MWRLGAAVHRAPFGRRFEVNESLRSQMARLDASIKGLQPLPSPGRNGPEQLGRQYAIVCAPTS